MPGIALQYLRREPARREGACRSTKDANTKKAAAFHNEAALSKIFVIHVLYFQFMRYRKPQNRRTHIRITMRSTKAIQTYRATR